MRKKTDVTPESRPNSIEIAVLATLTAINENLLYPQGKKKPADCLGAAYKMLREVDRDYPYRLIGEQMNKLAREGRPQSNEGEAHKVYTFNQVLQIQRTSPTTNDTLSSSGATEGGRIKSDKEFGKVFFHENDLETRPVRTTMVGRISTQKGLRKAINRLFIVEDAARIIRKRELTISEINHILQDQIKRNHGRIPSVRTTKENPI